MTVLQKQSRRDRSARAYESLEGLCCGDAFGERFFVREEMALSLINGKAIPAPPWKFTDDTVMAISIVSTLEEHGEIDQDHLAMSFARNYDSTRGYGPAMHGLLASIRQRRGHWREEARSLFGGRGSFGNGSAMRVAPLGAYFADDLDMVVELAERSAVTTHCHAEAVAGATAVALAAALAWQHKNAPQLFSASEFLQEIHQGTRGNGEWDRRPRHRLRDRGWDSGHAHGGAEHAEGMTESPEADSSTLDQELRTIPPNGWGLKRPGR